METDLEFSSSLRSGATYACITKGLTGKKKKEEKRRGGVSPYCLPLLQQYKIL